MTTFVVQNRGVEQLVARRAHNPEAGGSSPSPATKQDSPSGLSFFYPSYQPKSMSGCYKTKTEAENPASVPLCGFHNNYRTNNYHTIADAVQRFREFIHWYESVYDKKPWE